MMGTRHHTKLFFVEVLACELFYPSWPQTEVLPVSTTQVIRITGMSYHAHPIFITPSKLHQTLELVKSMPEQSSTYITILKCLISLVAVIHFLCIICTLFCGSFRKTKMLFPPPVLFDVSR
jgi:hypothetical protein